MISTGFRLIILFVSFWWVCDLLLYEAFFFLDLGQSRKRWNSIPLMLNPSVCLLNSFMEFDAVLFGFVC